MKTSSLASFAKKNPAFGIFLTRTVNIKDNFISAMHLFELLNKYNMANDQITSDNCKIFCDNKIKIALEKFLTSSSSDLIPLKLIRINKHILPSDHLKHFDDINQDFLENFNKISIFQKKFNIKVIVDIRFKVFDSVKAVRLCEMLIKNHINSINFIFDFPRFTKDSAPPFISEIKQFCANPILKNTEIILANLPHCFVPDTKYKLLYRHIIGALKGKVNLQRNIIRELKGKGFTYFKPCKKCRCKIPCYSYTDIRHFPEYSRSLFPKTQNSVVFVGGSLRETEKYSDNDIVYTTPIQQGDMFMTLLEGFKNILIIDGYFCHEFPCTTFEALLALEEGRNVLGSSSMGALRAVELDNYGMVGVGYVYNYLKNKKIKPYHVVAQIYDTDNKPLSTPLINIIYFLKAALNKKIIERSDFYKSFNVANSIHFVSLTFQYFFKRLESSKILPQNIIEEMKNYFYLAGEDNFNIKRKDALLLLKSYKNIIAKRNSSCAAFKLAKNKYLKILYKKYSPSYNLTLPKNWPKSLGEKVRKYLKNTKNIRERSPKDTSRLASKFFEDLGIVIADVSKFEQLNNVTINIFFIPFYFLGYYLASSNGMGCNITEALACAYMECLERIPTGNIYAKFLPRLKNKKNRICAYEKIPQYYNWKGSLCQKKVITKRYGYVKVSEILSNKNFYIPKIAIMSETFGTDGNASGNTYAESILYGIYELIERDVSKIYDSIGYDLKSKLVINNEKIKDVRCLDLIKELESLGCRIFLSNLINIYGVVCIQCKVFDVKKEIIRHGGAVARIDYNSAVFESLFEAYMQYMIDFVGSRDDYATLRNNNFDFHRLYSLFCNLKYTEKDLFAAKFNSVNDEFSMLLKMMKAAGVKDIFVANISPKDKYLLKSVKVIIPGMELLSLIEYKRSLWYKEKLKNTVSEVHAYIEGSTRTF